MDEITPIDVNLKEENVYVWNLYLEKKYNCISFDEFLDKECGNVLERYYYPFSNCYVFKTYMPIGTIIECVKKIERKDTQYAAWFDEDLF